VTKPLRASIEKLQPHLGAVGAGLLDVQGLHSRLGAGWEAAGRLDLGHGVVDAGILVHQLRQCIESGNMA